VHYENTEAIVAAVVDLKVDRSTGVVRVNHVWIGHDCGLIVNPDGLRNQIEGNVLQATSRALHEAVQFEGSRVASVDWASYPILRFEEVPDVTIRLVDRPNDRVAGAGEAATTVIAPAIANAIFAQTGKRLRRVPFTPDAVLAALR
jgi:CO/xanthine dehydrogenase Mo-binding subunit